MEEIEQSEIDDILRKCARMRTLIKLAGESLAAVEEGIGIIEKNMKVVDFRKAYGGEENEN